MSYGYPQPYQYQPPYGAYPQYQPPQQPQQIQRQQPVTGYSCRPVADEAEARAIPTDFNGTTMVLVDQAHGSIYTKGLNPVDGTPVFLAYRLQQPAVQAPVEYATTDMVAKLQAELRQLKKLLEIDDGGDA